MTLSGFFFLCLLGGLIWAAISLIMSGGFGGADASDVQADSGGIGDGDLSGEITFSPVSPTVIAVFITAFGGGGIVAQEGLKWGALASMALACGSGAVIAGLVYEILSAVYKRTQGSSEPRMEDLIGITAEALIPIPEDGLGEIAFVSKGARSTGAARSIDNVRIEKNSPVEIVKIAGATLYVRPLSSHSKSKEE